MNRRLEGRCAIVTSASSGIGDEGRPSPGFVRIDSPLVVHREPGPGEEGFSPDVKGHLYEGIARDFSDAQVVVFENDGPAAELGRGDRDSVHGRGPQTQRFHSAPRGLALAFCP